ncbi:MULTISPECIES: cobalamin-independent methionine synthase II family protein [unclassified Novosphingobium]|uniref:cobalamin-independent methionine synthase II family protein n=1 Tax=unclassified Novosphingobium TaxID=2644732 RepID=UPI0008684F74|nr:MULTISPECIES: cobalamin-independent methionine synthase II family protein [unclassified Novosphingobium]MBN9146044.1 cobalamin-independent methionine synthase II family protein [Novosphingobium sp.]MDR6709415.1 5-methyltetrahydropteroyltriglutamate--homocysteine methyltransferase [Novosphingobium sp. 1748]ODU80213.1 MAG: enterotoxin [Novosphingobium sp. SCN 63-17]OJX94139.1 MAG: epoxyalkane--coenzyme M transferase [Novosphingobium sp. 63-713]
MPHIRTTHVGSMPRGEELTPLLIARDRGEPYDAAEFDAKVSAAVKEAVRHQVECGVDIVSDGEIGKIGYSTYMIERLSGFGGHVDRKSALDLAEHPALVKKLSAMMGSQDFVRASCVGPIKLVNLEPLHEDIRRFKAALAQEGREGTQAFMNAASPGLITAFQVNKYYPSHEAYLADLAEAMRTEYETIVDEGFYLQLDCPDLAMSRHTGYQDLSEAEFLKVAEENVAALNAATANIPPERMRMHICWGNYEGPHDHDIPLERVVDIILKARPATILFEAANPRHEHEWKVWADAKIPDHKILAPGLIDTCSNYVEHPELIAQRIERFAGIVGAERVVASTDCGFGTFAGYGKIDPDVTWKKLRSLREGADIAGARL